MPGMFDNYNNPAPACNHMPMHRDCLKPKNDFNPNISSKPNKPYESYDEEGNIIGYWWYEGDTVTLDFDIDGEIIADQEVIEEVNGQPSVSIKPVRVPIEDFIIDKQITFNMYNFRGEIIFTQDYEGATNVRFDIDLEKAALLTKGNYTISLSVWDGETFNKTIYSKEDCTITIK